jgi:hypothetical protein
LRPKNTPQGAVLAVKIPTTVLDRWSDRPTIAKQWETPKTKSANAADFDDRKGVFLQLQHQK